MKKKLLCMLMTASIFAGLSTVCMAEDSASEEPYTIHYMAARGSDEGVVLALSEIAEMYKEEHPNFNLEMEVISNRSEYLQKMKILASSNELPELFDSDADSFFATLVSEGQVADIDQLYEELGVSDKIFINSREYQRMGNGFLGLICWQGNIEYFFYNKDVFAAAGIETPPTTWDEFFEDCEKIKEAGIVPIAIAGADQWRPLRYLAFKPFRLTGNDFIEKARVGEESFGSETGIAAAEFVQQVGQYWQPGWNTTDNTTQNELVISGSAAMTYEGTWALSSFVDENMELLENIGMFTLPVVGENDATEATDYWAHAGIGTAVRADALNDQMKEFLSFVFEKYPDIALYEYNSVPSFMPTIKDDLSELYKNIIDNYSSIETYAYCWDVRVDSASSEVMARETPNLALGSITPEEWAARMDEAILQNVVNQ